MRGQTPRTTTYATRVRWRDPQSLWLAKALGWLYGKAISGDNGTVRYGYPGLDTDRGMYKGYVFPPQAFTGYDPERVAAGFVRPDPASLPCESLDPYAASTSPIVAAMAA